MKETVKNILTVPETGFDKGVQLFRPVSLEQRQRRVEISESRQTQLRLALYGDGEIYTTRHDPAN